MLRVNGTNEAASARRFRADDPSVKSDVWRDMAFHATPLRPLPDRPLPRP
jgi:hypothetical protein